MTQTIAELYPNAQILTLDSDFHIYRQHRNQQIPLRIPDSLSSKTFIPTINPHSS